jgi:hypothetical protein
VIASAIRLATNTAEYTGCTEARTQPNAAAIRVLSDQPFAAELEIEPPHRTDIVNWAEGPMIRGDEEGEQPECPVRARVTWTATGFEVRHPEDPPPCAKTRALLVRIDDEGEIRTIDAPRVPADDHH